MRIPRTHWVDFMSPTNPHGLRFVEGGEGAAAPAEQGAKPSDKADDKTTDEPLGDAGKKALESEREARRELERQMGQMREAFAQALGVDGSKKSSTDDLLAQMQQQMATLQKNDLVSRVAREAQIVDAEDIATIAEASTEEGMRRIASRIASAATPPSPKPDRSQGGTGETHVPDPGPGVARLTQAFEEKFATP